MNGPTRFEVLAACLGALWMIAVGAFFLKMPPSEWAGVGFDSLRLIMMLLAVFMPVGVIAMVIAAARAHSAMRTENAKMQSTIDAIRQAVINTHSQQPAAEPNVEKKLEELVQATKNTETALTNIASKRQVSRLIVPQPAPNKATSQRTLPLGTSSDELSPPLDRGDLIRGLNFPDNEQDTEGFAALRRTLEDRTARKLVQASQDVLTLLSQDGIYMDDLRPDRPDVDLWRRFAQGERGEDMARVGGVRDRTALALTTGRMREDTIFRDTVHHFLRKFDQMLTIFEQHADDDEIHALVDTRTARAFVLLGRTAGTFT